MAGSRTEGEKRRRKKAARNQEAWAEAEKRGRGRPPLEGIDREPNGQPSRKARRGEALMRPVLDARAKALGIYIPEPKQLPGESMEEFIARKNSRDSAMRSATPVLRREWAGCAVGQAIAEEADVVDLWRATTLIRARRAAYLRALDADPEQAKTATLPIKPSAEETAPQVHSSAEPLTEQEAAETAVENWEAMRDVIFAVDPLAVRFAIDRICAEVAGANENAVPKAPLFKILRAVVVAYKLRTAKADSDAG